MITLFRSLFSPPRHLILVLAGLWVGLSLAEKRAEQRGLPKDALSNLVFYSIIGYVIGGRLLFALSNLSAFSDSPLNIFSVNIDLFDPFGAMVTMMIVGVIYGRRQQLPFWSTLDSLTPLLAILAIGLSLSHLAAGTAFGSPTELPWGMELWNATRHPTQVYEFIASMLIFGFIWLPKNNAPAGYEFLVFIAATAGARLFLEAFRGDSTLIFSGVRQAQVLAWLILAMAFFLLQRIQRQEQVK